MERVRRLVFPRVLTKPREGQEHTEGQGFREWDLFSNPSSDVSWFRGLIPLSPACSSVK